MATLEKIRSKAKFFARYQRKKRFVACCILACGFYYKLFYKIIMAKRNEF